MRRSFEVVILFLRIDSLRDTCIHVCVHVYVTQPYIYK